MTYAPSDREILLSRRSQLCLFRDDIIDPESPQGKAALRIVNGIIASLDKKISKLPFTEVIPRDKD